MAYKTFDANQTSLVIGGAPVVGFAIDSAISIKTEASRYKNTRDLHGNVTRYRINDNSAEITLNLTQSSRSNQLLSNYLELDRQSDSGVFSVYLKDSNGTTFFTSDSAYIEKAPTLQYGEEEKNREWVIQATNITYYVGH